MRFTRLNCIVVLLGLLAGTSAGWHFGRLITDGRLVWQEMFAAAEYGQLASFQYEQADPERGRQALLSFADFVQSLSKLPSAKDDRAIHFDCGFAYMRLAALEDRSGNTGLSHLYALRAREEFQDAGYVISEGDLAKKISNLTRPAAFAPAPK
jgi:hypothetical protein